MSILVLFGNGVLIGEIVKAIPDASLYYFIYHGIFELSGFLFFSVIGMRGMDFYINLLKNNTVGIFFDKRLFMYSSLLIIIGAIIETFFISSI